MTTSDPLLRTVVLSLEDHERRIRECEQRLTELVERDDALSSFEGFSSVMIGAIAGSVFGIAIVVAFILFRFFGG